MNREETLACILSKPDNIRRECTYKDIRADADWPDEASVPDTVSRMLNGDGMRKDVGPQYKRDPRWYPLAKLRSGVVMWCGAPFTEEDVK